MMTTDQNPVMDYLQDVNGAERHRLGKLYEFPGYVKEAADQSLFDVAGKPAVVYADPAKNRYPCHTKAATWLSAVFFQAHRHNLPAKTAAWVEDRLTRMADYWGIGADVAAVKARTEALAKTADDALPDAAFAYAWVDDRGVRHRELRIANSAEVKAAAAWLNEHRDQLPFADRHAIAGKILAKAEKFGADLGEHDRCVEQQAGRGVCSPDEVVGMLRGRAKLAARTEVRDSLEKLAHMVQTKPRAALAPDTLVKLAETVDSVDRGLGIAGKYTDLIRRPEEVIFATLYKDAQAGIGNACRLATGVVYDKADFKKIAARDLEALYGRDLTAQVTTGLDVDPEKLAEVAATFPPADADLFEKLLAEAGVPPIMGKAAGAPPALADAAAAYAAKY